MQHKPNWVSCPFLPPFPLTPCMLTRALPAVTARHDSSVSTRRLATLALACDEARAARRTAKKVLERKYGDRMLEIGHNKLERFSTAIQERLEEVRAQALLFVLAGGRRG